jgi:arylformamidase
MTAYKDKKVVQVIATKDFERDGAREMMLCLSSHTGTHVDAPSHFLQHGADINHVPLTSLIGVCRVLDCTHIKDSITEHDLEQYDLQKDMIVLFKTKNSSFDAHADFNPAFIYLTQDGARYLVEKKVKAVGIDYLGIERGQSNHGTHTALLHAQIPIIEGLRLEHVLPKDYFLYCLPLALAHGDGAPARAILIEE